MDYEKTLLGKMKEEARCPVCSVIEDFEYDQLAHLQYDITENANIRRQVANRGGFCSFHFRQFRKLASERTNALLLHEMVACHLDGRSPAKLDCPVCSRTKDHEGELVKALISLLETREARFQYSESSGLCISHSRKATELASSQEIRDFLRDSQLRQFSKLSHTLDKMIAKAYLDTTTQERGAIPTTVEKFAGVRGIAF
jgi:hypothetical protein